MNIELLKIIAVSQNKSTKWSNQEKISDKKTQRKYKIIWDVISLV